MMKTQVHTVKKLIDRRGEMGATAIVVALFFSFIALPVGAVSVDVARLYVELQRVQAAADAAATAGVTFMPENFADAQKRAWEVAASNGFTDKSAVKVETGDKPTQLKVTVSSTVDNAFASTFGVPTSTMRRSALADFNGPAPMGSPCNNFGNEPAGSVLQGPRGTVIKAPTKANCPRTPEFWGSMSGPEVAKDQGSQFEVRKCDGGEDGCANGSAGAKNEEFDPRGYIYLVSVTPDAVGKSIDLQIYDPATVPGEYDCRDIPYSGSNGIGSNYPNRWTDDAYARYKREPGAFCAGDGTSAGKRFPSNVEVPTVTSFGLRAPINTLNPYTAPPVPGCAKQYPGYKENWAYWQRLTNGSGYYDDELSEYVHQWDSLCTFTPTEAGDYYLQVRTNVPEGNANAVYTQTGDNTSVKGNSINMFALRANSSAPAGAVSVSSFEKMRIFSNATGSVTTFNLVRVVPAAANKTLVVSFFDLGEGASNGSVRLIPPEDSNLGGNAPTCAVSGVANGTRSACMITGINSTSYNGKLQFMRVPLPNTYTCDISTRGGCWWRVEVNFGGNQVRDATTWGARIEGEPVRLVE